MPALTTTLCGLLGEAVVLLEPIGGGRNSQVYRVTCRSGRRVVAKSYSPHPFGEQDRLRVEFSSLQFLRRHGVTNVPEPIAADLAAQCAVYEAIDGTPMPSSTVTARDIDDVVAFLARLRALSGHPESRSLPPAAEACFSVGALTDCIEQRLCRLAAATRDKADGPYRALRAFIQGRFRLALDEIVRWCHAECERVGRPVAQELPEAERTLSPSDVGFHNALRREGRIVFLDFEYFGWDDPAKLAADFLLHPAMELSPALKRRFVSELLSRFDSGGDALPTRLRIVYPLYGLKWCLIFLNEFVPQDLSRRDFAQREVQERGEVQAEQLAKAQRMFDQVMKEYADFPHRDISL